MDPTSSTATADLLETGRPSRKVDAPFPRDGAGGADQALTLFAVLWAMATVFHQIAYPIRHDNAAAYALTLAALWLLVRPSSTVRLLLLAAIQAGWVVYSFPSFVTNHWIFTTFVNAAIWLAFLAVAVAQRDPRVDRSRLFDTFAPAARVSLLVLYFYAVFHKLNEDYFDPQSSCAVEHYQSIASVVWLLPTDAWTHHFAIVGSLLIESAIPILLCFRRTRVAGLFLGLCFHMALGVNPNHRFFNFSAMVFAVYFLFLPFDFRNGLREVLQGTAGGRRILLFVGSASAGRAFRVAVLIVMALLATAYLLGLNPRDADLSLDASGLSRLLWVVYGGFLILAFLLAARRWDVVSATSHLVTFRPAHRALWIVPAVVFFNGLNPYLGLKTDTVFSMFSNLRTEGGGTNHFIMPGGIRLVGYQDDLVRVVHSSTGWLQQLAEGGYLITYFELRRITAATPEMSLTYVRNGELHVVPRVGDDPELSRHFPLWQRMVLDFRAVNPSGRRYMCVH